MRGAGTEFGVVDDHWFVSAGDRGSVDVRVRYQRSMPARAKLEMFVHSAVEPSFYRIYRVDKGVEVIRSAASNMNRAEDLQLVVKATWLADLRRDREARGHREPALVRAPGLPARPAQTRDERVISLAA